MMDRKKIRCSLNFEVFDLELIVGLDESVEYTEGFRPPGVDGFIFAVGEIWLRTEKATCLLVEERDAGNMMATLEMLKHELGSLRAIPGLDQRIEMGGWCEWTHGYWERLRADCATEDDESTYDLLRAALLVDSKSGCVVGYRYGEAAILEACLRPQTSISVSVWSKIDPNAVCASIDAASSQLSNAIRARLWNC